MHPNLTDSISQRVGVWETQALFVAGSPTATQSTRVVSTCSQRRIEPSAGQPRHPGLRQKEGHSSDAAAAPCLHSQDVSAADEMASVTKNSPWLEGELSQH